MKKYLEIAVVALVAVAIARKAPFIDRFYSTEAKVKAASK